jgi:hypothetical protein
MIFLISFFIKIAHKLIKISKISYHQFKHYFTFDREQSILQSTYFFTVFYNIF